MLLVFVGAVSESLEEDMCFSFALLLFQVCLPMTIREYFWDAV